MYTGGCSDFRGMFDAFLSEFLILKKNHEEWKSNMLKFYQKERFLI